VTEVKIEQAEIFSHAKQAEKNMFVFCPEEII